MNGILDFFSILLPDYNDPYSSWEPAKFVKTRFSSALLLDKKGYVYKINSKNGSKIYWVCRNHLKDKNNKCLARATTDGNYVTYWKGVHNHPTNILQSDVILENWNKAIFYLDFCNISFNYFLNLLPDQLEVGNFIKSKFGNALLLDKEGYVYKSNCKDKTGRKTYWICRDYGNKNAKIVDSCPARATTDGIYVKKWKGIHNHPPTTEAHLQNYKYAKTGIKYDRKKK